MRRFALSVMLCGSALSLGGCGFEPMYASGPAKDMQSGVIQSELAQVEIENIPDREGQFLRNALIDRFYRDGRPASPRYKLLVKPIRESKTDLDITKSSDATRGQLKLSSAIALVDLASGETVLKRNLVSIGSYNILGSEFANRVTEQNTRDNALNDLARQIELQVGLYLKR
ncbi:MAG: hypothetical protein KDI90_11090 [Alphaproteobacteria bacterium]|nr:hypothetical protein [Alphaproteobacteria bacterium]MCB9975125.1 hypothetical protein [Rhodospirillales bacterium]